MKKINVILHCSNSYTHKHIEEFNTKMYIDAVKKILIHSQLEDEEQMDIIERLLFELQE